MPATRRPSIGRSTCESCGFAARSSPIPPVRRSSARCGAGVTCFSQPARHRRWTEAKLPHRTKQFVVINYLYFVVGSATKQFIPATKPFFVPDVTSQQQAFASQVG